MDLLRTIRVSRMQRPLAACWRALAPTATVYRTVWGIRIFMDLRDNIDDFTRPRTQLETREAEMMRVLDNALGLVWDVGCNVGFFSARAATAGHPVVAFDLSPKSIGFLQRTASYNGMDITAVPLPLTPEATSYEPATSSHKGNRIKSAEGACRSLGFREASTRYGVPSIIKMDIEGGEKDFFDSSNFKQWIIEHRITWMVEVHPEHVGYPEWPDVPHAAFDANRVAVYNADQRILDGSLRVPRQLKSEC